MKAARILPVAIVAAGLGACIPKADPGQAAQQTTPADMTGPCVATNLDRHIGKMLTPELGEQMRKEANADLLRTAPDGGMITMDYNVGRLNIFYNDQKVIVRVNCG